MNGIQVSLVLRPHIQGWEQAFPRLEIETSQEGDTLITKRYLVVSGARVTLWSMQTESVSHILNQATLQMEAENIGYVRSL